MMSSGSGQFTNAAKSIAEKLRQIAGRSRIPEGWVDLLPIESLVSPYGAQIEPESSISLFTALAKVEIEAATIASFKEFQYRLYTDVLKTHSTADFVSVAGRGSGRFQVDVFAESEDMRRPLRTVWYDGKVIEFLLPKIPLSEVFPGESLTLAVYAAEHTKLDSLRWVGISRSGKKNGGVNVVAIRTFGNKNIVQDNLEKLAIYSEIRPGMLNSYLFVVYDANSDGVPLQVDTALNVIYLHGGNYGGGGNASLLVALLELASKQAPEVKIEDVILWDDDAVLEPQMFVRHSGFIRFRRPNVSHTGVVFSKSSPGTIQEYGGIWGDYFDLKTGLPTVSQSDHRHMYPYLVRHGISILEDFGRRRIAANQSIEFGTFIYLSVPFQELLKTRGTLPFFLRNDDVDLGLRLKAVGGDLVVNANLFAWHEASHNIAGEFFAALHGLVINQSYFGVSPSWFANQMSQKLSGCYEKGHLALLQAYCSALELYVRGPDWVNTAECFDLYKQKLALIGSALKKYRQVPESAVDVSKAVNLADVHILVDATSRLRNAGAEVIFLDTNTKSYLQPDKNPVAVADMYIRSIGLLNTLLTDYEKLSAAWKDFVLKFDGVNYWTEYYFNSTDSLVVGETSPGDYSDDLRASMFSTYPDIRFSDTQTKLLEESVVRNFNAKVYYMLNPDVEAAGCDAWEHYQKHGRIEGRRYK